MNKICSFLVLAFTFLPLRSADSANYYKCTDVNGKILITNTSCPGDINQIKKFRLRDATQEEMAFYRRQVSKKESEERLPKLSNLSAEKVSITNSRYYGAENATKKAASESGVNLLPKVVGLPTQIKPP